MQVSDCRSYLTKEECGLALCKATSLYTIVKIAQLSQLEKNVAWKGGKGVGASATHAERVY